MNRRAPQSEAQDQMATLSKGTILRPAGNREEVRDLTKQRSHIEQTSHELAWLIEYRSRLLARLAHELRNPLTSILGFAEILLNYEELTEAQTDFCQKIQNAALQIEANLSLLSDLARLETGPPQLVIEEFSLADALRETCLVLSRQAQKQNALLHWRVDHDIPPIVSDRGKLRQVLYNLIAHAISRSPDGASVKASAEKRGDEFHLTVEDEGETPAVSLPILFTGERFLSNDVETAELGLAIAGQLIESLGAKLSFSSGKPNGLTAVLQVPAHPPPWLA